MKKGEPFDPEDLSRRLQAHLTEQKIKADKRRQARAAKLAAAEAAAAESHAQTVYHHVPMSAASAFERTTTPVDLSRKMPKLAQSVIKAHLGRVSVDENRPSQGLTLLQKTVALDQAIVDKQILRNRNQFQWTQEMEEANEADLERDLYKPPQRTFNGGVRPSDGNAEERSTAVERRRSDLGGRGFAAASVQTEGQTCAS